MYRILLTFLCFIALVETSRVGAQCTPPMAETCEESNVLCSLDEVNGYTCNNPSTIASACSPLCSQGGVGHNTSWWGFVTQGGNVTVTLTIGGCTTNQGLQYGIWGDCVCGEEIACFSIPCAPPGSVNTITGNLLPCKTYYLWVDGCSGDICDFTLNTSGGGPPSLSPLGFINNKANMIIEPVCEGACNVLLFVNDQPGGCSPTYVWTLDGDEVGGNDNEVRLDFPTAGDFIVCVTAYIGNPQSGSVCSQEGPKCATVKVRPIADRTGVPRTICWEQANPGGYKWHTQRIFTSGQYREQFTDANCCKFDSVVDFTVLDKPEPADVFYITCDNEPYIDILGRAHTPCKNKFEIALPKTTDPFRCDSSITLTAVNVEFEPRWRVQCFGGQVEISPNITIIKPCSVGETYQFDFRWYKKNDPNKATISTDERIMVDAVKEDYCVEVNVRVELETEFALCAKTFCETYNEDDLAPKGFPLNGDLPLCIGKNGSYWIDTFLNTKVLFYTWTIDGGSVVSNPDSEYVDVKWLLGPGDTGLVCVFYDTDCGKSPEICMKVPILASPAPDAGPNDSICDLANRFQGKKDVGGLWTQLSGPGTSNINDTTDPTSDVTVDQYGRYTYIYTESRLGCTTTDTVDLYFNSTPDSSALTYICNVKQTQYKLRFLVTGGTPPYTVVQGNGTVDANNFYNSNFHDNNTNYTILIRDVMGCILTFNFNHECKCTNVVGTLDPLPQNICEDQSFDIFYDPTGQKLDPGDTIIYVVTTDPDETTVAGGTFIKMLTSTTVVYDALYMNYGITYYVFVLLGKKNGNGGIDYQLGCVQLSGPKPFVFYENPIPNAGPDDAICGTVYDLNGVQSITGSNLQWKVISGGAAQFANDASSTTSVNTQGQYGTFVFELSEDNHSCAAADRVTITFNPSPVIQVDEKICVDYNDPDYPYIAKVRITTGQPPYTIIQGGGSISGNIYTTDTLASLVNFSVEIRDANGCISNLIIDNYNCDCGAVDAGRLDSAITELCVDQCVSIKSLIPEVLDPEDVAMYVFHQSTYNDQVIPRLDTFYSINDQVCFDASKGMQTGITYYITRVVGNDSVSPGPDKVVDSNDPCLRASNNQPIVWYPYPTPNAGLPDSVCFYDYQLNGTTNAGAPTWRFVSSVPPGLNSTIANTGSDVTNVTVSGKGTYRYELTENFKNCISTTTVDITHWDAPNFTNTRAPECDGNAEKYRITVDGANGDRPSWSVDGYTFPSGPLPVSNIGNDTWRTDWILNNDIYRLIITDRHNCLPDTISDTYECPCINGIGPLDKTPFILCIDGTANVAPRYTAAQGTPDGNDVIRYVLYDGNSFDPTGTHLNYSTSGIFTFQPGMQPGKTYYVAVVMGNPDPNNPDKVILTDRCLKFDVLPVTWYDYPVAKITGPALLTCAVTSISLDGNTSTSGSGTTLRYLWSGPGISGPNNNGTVNVTDDGIYKLFVTDTVSGCTNEITYKVDVDVNKPTVAIGNPDVLTCDRTSVVLDGSSSSQGTDYNVRWTGPGNISGGNTYNPTVDATGTYYIIVTNKVNGCVDSTSMDVDSDLKKPIPDINPLGQLTCSVKQIQLDASGSQGQSGTISSYIWQSVNGNIIAGLGTSKITVDKEGTYSVRVKDQNNGCDSLTTITIQEIGNPFAGIDLVAQNPLCFGERNGMVDVTAIIANGPVNGLEYNFNNQGFSTRTTYPNLSQGTYNLKVRDANGCLHDTTVTLIEPGKLGIQVIKSIVVDQDTRVNLDSMLLNISGGTTNYADTAWFNIKPPIDWENNLSYLADTTREFLITVTDAAGCQIQERVRVIVRIIKDVWWPSVFSPNGDQTNDSWNLKGKRVRNIRTLNIYDRWGELVYSAENLKDGNLDASAGWKGDFDGEKALPGVYVFYAEVEYVGSEGFDKYKGDFTLIR